jgi:mono/diheme cytochrome c family protein
MPVIPDFTDPSWQQSHTKVQLMVSILEGKDRLMPANRGPVSDDQAPDLVAYIRTFGPVEAVPTAEVASTSDFGVEFNKLQQQWDDLDRQLRQLRSAPVATKSPAPTSAPTGVARFFGQNCAGCHTIGGGALTGPDLKHVTARRDRSWLVRYLHNPKAVIESGDPYALHLLAEARGVVMPKPFGMTQERAEGILEFIDAESKREPSQFAGPPTPDMPFGPGDAGRGRDLFVGRRRLANGGPACITCHTAHGLEGIEGGRLGPELTKVYERVGGRTSLTARLWAPATPTMLPVYKEHALQLDEVMSLVAYLEETDRQGVEQASGPPRTFFLLGLGGTVLGLAAVSVLWGIRFRPRSQPLDNGRVAAAAGAETGPPPLNQGRGTLAAAPPACQELAPGTEDYVGLGL